MWKSIRYCVYARPLRENSCANDVFKQILSVLDRKSVNVCLLVRHQTTDAKGSGDKLTYTIAKRPPPSYLRNIQPKKEKPQSGIPPGAWMLLSVPAITFALGTWQIKRRKWKLGVIEELEKRIQEPPIDFPEDLAEISRLEYRKVKVKGKFDHSQELYLGPCSLLLKGKPPPPSGLISVGNNERVGGHCVITPFILSGSGKRILVNRGWVPTKTIQPGKRVEGQIEDEVELVGIVRLQEEKSTFTPENKPHIRVFHYRDIKKMAKKCDTLPVYLDATEEYTVPGGPIAGQTNVSIRNEHDSYIFTWYSLSALTAILWFKKFVLRSA